LLFRIGINIGDVIVADDNLYGGGGDAAPSALAVFPVPALAEKPMVSVQAHCLISREAKR
jgi:hypothetical protein